jgi:hypothetical protein
MIPLFNFFMSFFMHNGEECYSSLKATLARMFREGHLSNKVDAQFEGTVTTIAVRWHLCADHKMVCLACGLGRASCGRPCPWCHWLRLKPQDKAQTRTAAETEQHAGWATSLPKPLQVKVAELIAARQALKDVKSGSSGKKLSPEQARKLAEEAKEKIKEAGEARDTATTRVRVT